jgi:N-acetylmuramoyl-L-alanine amidase
MGKSTIVYASGHGGHDKGNTTTGIIERDELISITAGMRRWFELNNHPIQQAGGVVFIDNGLELAGELTAIRDWKLNAADDDLAINGHLDYRRGGSGALVICNQLPLAQQVARQFLARWCEETGIRNNGVHDSKRWARTQRGWNNMGFCAVNYPAIIVEFGCLNSEFDMQRVRDGVNQALAAQLFWETWRSCRGIS